MCEWLTLDSLFQSQSPQVILVVPSSQMLTPISDKKAKILLGMGATQLALGILEIVLNIGASIMWAHVAYFVGPGYWCGIFVSYGSFSHQGDVTCESSNWQLDCLFNSAFTWITWIRNAMVRITGALCGETLITRDSPLKGSIIRKAFLWLYVFMVISLFNASQ